MTYLPHIQDIEKWKRHFVNMAEGKARRNIISGIEGYYVVDSIQNGGGKTHDIPVKMVTPVAQAVELAKSELEEEEEKNRMLPDRTMNRKPRVYKRKRVTAPPPPPKKKRKKQIKKDKLD